MRFTLERAIRTLIVLLLGVFVYVIFDSFREKVTVVGDSAPDFSITTDNGRTITTSNFGGKLLVLNFWATWCPPCIDELPSLNEFQRHFANSGVVVLGVSIDKDEKAYKDFLARARVSFLTARDPESKINVDYGTLKVPETYIIDTQGKVVRKVINAQDWMSDRVIKDTESLL
ncbi:MAG TPA: TlpA disulfide reductase family protein [Candidatus Solibacter sp.]|nr:TlpA disulfide reductase family protein [Candidatus Solibacter sp.]